MDINGKDINKSVLGDPTETALVKALFRGKNEIKSFTDKGRRIYDNPFDSDRKMMSVIVQDGSGETCYVKGAPERVIKNANTF